MHLKKKFWHPREETVNVSVLEKISVDYSRVNRMNLQSSTSSVETPLQALGEHNLGQFRVRISRARDKVFPEAP
jgi:hypothetical protein